jgi:hypothetical protein
MRMHTPALLVLPRSKKKKTNAAALQALPRAAN